MLGSPILDVALGMAFIYLLLSLIASAIQELLSSLVESRSANLYNGIRSLLSGDTELVERLYNHGLIAGLYRNPLQDFAGLGGSSFRRVRLWLQPLVGIARIAPPPGNEPTLDPLLLPAYIPARTFALALMDLLNPSRATNWDLMSGIRQTLQDPSAQGKTYVALRALALRAGDDGEAFQSSLEDWYNDAMDRVSGWYKKHVQNVLLVVAVLLAVSFNVDSIRIGRTLWVEPTLRQAVTTAADAYIQGATAAAPAAQLPPSGSPDYPGARLQSTVSAFNDVSSNLNLPVGWHRTLPQYWQTLQHPSWTLTRIALQSGIGWLITAFALSFGAPFWFDTLNRFMIVRGTIKPREKSAVDPPKD